MPAPPGGGGSARAVVPPLALGGRVGGVGGGRSSTTATTTATTGATGHKVVHNPAEDDDYLPPVGLMQHAPGARSVHDLAAALEPAGSSHAMVVVPSADGRLSAREPHSASGRGGPGGRSGGGGGSGGRTPVAAAGSESARRRAGAAAALRLQAPPSLPLEAAPLTPPAASGRRAGAAAAAAAPPSFEMELPIAEKTVINGWDAVLQLVPYDPTVAQQCIVSGGMAAPFRLLGHAADGSRLGALRAAVVAGRRWTILTEEHYGPRPPRGGVLSTSPRGGGGRRGGAGTGAAAGSAGPGPTTSGSSGVW